MQWIRLVHTQQLASTDFQPDYKSYMGKHGWMGSRITLGIFNSYSASHDNWCTVGGGGGCRVGEVRAGTTFPMPDHKGFKLQ